MKENYRFEKKDFITWMIRNDDAERIPGIDEKCTVENIQAYLDERIPGCTVRTAYIEPSGVFNAPTTPWMQKLNVLAGYVDTPVETIPFNMGSEFVYVEVGRKSPAGTDRIGFLMPTVWNGRYFTVNGAGPFTDIMWEIATSDDLLRQERYLMPNICVQNGFATGWTDSAIDSDKLIKGASMVWDPIDLETGRFNEALLRNYDYMGKHVCNQVCKAIIECLTGQQPAYSYSEGGSGGGRASLRMAQRCPEDFDGIWAEAPYCPYHECGANIAWAQTVLRELGYMSYAKFEAFRDAVHKSVGGMDAWLRILERHEFDAYQCIGMNTEAGPITETDAKIMNLIWDGPRRKDGSRICIGWRPGALFWDKGWLTYILDEDGNPIGLPEQDIATRSYAIWVKHDPEFDWTTINFDNFEEWYDDYYRGFAEYDMLDDDRDLSRLKNADTKLIICVGTEDEYVPCDRTVQYYNEVSRVTFNGDIAATRNNVRLFLAPGNDHIASLNNDGWGPTLSESMTALMKWVEEGLAPDVMPGVHFDFATVEVDNEGDTFVY